MWQARTSSRSATLQLASAPPNPNAARMLERISRSVFSCFHRFEKAVTKFTDRVGPACVFFCTVLLVLGTITFCEFVNRRA